jgi:autotransporter-associated beta strand protein
MHSRSLLSLTVISFAIFSSIGIFGSAQIFGQNKPNVIVIVTDDAGYADFGFARRGLDPNNPNADTSFRDFETGLNIPSLTPNLDALAARGVTMSRAYVAPNCQPTRAALVSGAYQQRIGFENVGNNNYLSSEVREAIPQATQTIWNRMKSQGYRTSAVGKWHLGATEDSAPGAFDGGRPQAQGIDEFRGIWHGSRNYAVGSVGNNAGSKNHQTQQLREAVTTHDASGNATSVTEQRLEDTYSGQYLTNTLGTLATDFIASNANQSEPFMLYQSFTAPHKPWTNQSPDYNDPRISGLRDGSYRRQVASLQITMDNEIGNILNRLEDPNGDGNTSDSITDDTLIVFVNDNGGVAGRDPNSPGGNLQGVDNGPFDGFKGSFKDGGIRVPMIIAGAGIDASAQGSVYDGAVHAVDVLPTVFAAAGGAPLSADSDKIDGVNLLPHINGTSSGPPHPEAIISKWQGGFAVAKDKGNDQWKLVNTQRNPQINYANRENNYRLYNTATDVAEQNNQINDSDKQDLVRELKRDLTKFESTFDKGRFAILARYVDDDMNNPTHGTADNDSTDSSISKREGRNIFDHFVFNPNGGTQNWSTTDGWFAANNEDFIPLSAAKLDPTDPNYSPEKTMYLSDSFAGAIVEFGTSDTQSYTANNDMFRQTGGDFMLNKVILSGSFNGSSDQTGDITGNPLLFTDDLNGTAAEIAIDAVQTGGNTFEYTISNELQLFDNLMITGNGNVNVTLGGVIRDFYSAANADFDPTSMHNNDSAFGSRGITKSGSSSVTLTGSNIYSGNTLIEEGTLAVSGNGSLNNTPVVNIKSDGTFDVSGMNSGEFSANNGQAILGDGVVNGNLRMLAGSVISPDADNAFGELSSGIGELEVNGDVTFETGSTLFIELAGDSMEGVDYDSLSVTGDLVAGGTLMVVLDSGFNPLNGDVFDILDFASFNGNFDSILLPTLDPGLAWDTSRLDSTGEIFIFNAIPEPSSAIFVLMIFGASIAQRRRS